MSRKVINFKIWNLPDPVHPQGVLYDLKPPNNVEPTLKCLGLRHSRVGSTLFGCILVWHITELLILLWLFTKDHILIIVLVKWNRFWTIKLIKQFLLIIKAFNARGRGWFQLRLLKNNIYPCPELSNELWLISIFEIFLCIF